MGPPVLKYLHTLRIRLQKQKIRNPSFSLSRTRAKLDQQVIQCIDCEFRWIAEGILHIVETEMKITAGVDSRRTRSGSELLDALSRGSRI